MSDISLQIVREFFELNMFRVLTNWQQDSWRTRPGVEPGTQLFVENTGQPVGMDADTVLHPHQLGTVERALVEVRAWHTDRLYPSTIEANPVFSQFVEEDSLAFAAEVFGSQDFDTILVLSELPATAEHRARSIQLLREAGIRYVMEFPSILQDLLDKVSIDASYAGSATLQTLRLLKRYRLVRHQQMEFAFRTDVSMILPPAPATATRPDDED